MTPHTATCPTHPDRASLGECHRCGRFMCGLCRSGDGRCVDCVARSQTELPDAAPRASAAVVVLFINVAADGLDAIFSALNLSRGTPSNPEQLSILDVFEGLLGLGQAVLFIVTVVLFLRWWHLMARHALARGIPLGATPGWAVGYWFVPFVNLARPYRIAKTVADGLGVTAPLGVWWGLWIASNIIANASARLNLSDATAGQGAATALGLVGTLLSIPAAFACVAVVRRIQEGLSVRPATVPAT